MTQFLYNLKKWKRFTEGEVLHYSNPNPRTVRLEINAADTVRLFIADPPGADAEFMAVVYGRDTIEFSADGPFDIVLDGGDCMLYTNDSTDWQVDTVDFQSFTRVVERRVRNPEQELMMFMAHQNMERRLAAQADELAEQFERRLAKRDAENAAALAKAERDKGASNKDGADNGGAKRQNVGNAPKLEGDGPDDSKPKAKA